MNLRDHLKDILPQILPANPAEAIKGTELIRLVRYRLGEEYSDATLRYHFSIMSCDPSSPIAKVEQGQGYYLRRSVLGGAHVSVTQARLGMLFETDAEALDLAVARERKFRAIFARDQETAGRFPFLFESPLAPDAPFESFWKCPDAAVLDWEASDLPSHGAQLSRRTLALRQAMGLPPFRLVSARLRIEVTHQSCRQDFFQALSNARWAHHGELVIATSLADEHLADELRQLGTEFGIGVLCYGLTHDELDELRPGYEIPRMTAREFEALQSRLKPQRICPSRPRSIDWATVERLQIEHREFDELFEWLWRCVRDERAYNRREFSSLEPEPSETPQAP
jgi:hypothetical protein